MQGNILYRNEEWVTRQVETEIETVLNSQQIWIIVKTGMEETRKEFKKNIVESHKYTEYYEC